MDVINFLRIFYLFLKRFKNSKWLIVMVGITLLSIEKKSKYFFVSFTISYLFNHTTRSEKKIFCIIKITIPYKMLLVWFY